MNRLGIAGLLVFVPVAFSQVDHPAPPAQPKVTIPAVPIQPAVTQEPTEAKKPKPAIYDESADARKQIAAAMKTAGKENRRILIQWGGNWCGWCHLLHETFKTDKAIAKELMYEYDVVLVDAGRNGKNLDLAKQYKADLETNGYPFLTVLDSAGTVIANQETGALELKTPDGKPTDPPGHDAQKVLAFLKANEAKPLAAASVLKEGRDAAQSSGKKVFVHFGAPWCGWCHKLDAWLAREDVAKLFGKDYVDVKIDNDRMPGAKEVFAKYNKNSERSGIPWFAIVDASTGEALATSDEKTADGKLANVGFPAQDNEIAHFVAVLKATATKLTDADIQTLKTTLEEGRKK